MFGVGPVGSVNLDVSQDSETHKFKPFVWLLFLAHIHIRDKNYAEPIV